MKQAIIDRTESCDEGTFGWLRVLDEVTGDVLFSCATVELPWRDNRPARSCVPAGRYLFKGRTDSPKHPGFVYEEWDDPATPEREDVVGRENVQIHALNLAGDIDKDYVAQALGCIGLGTAVIKFRAGNKPAGSRDQRGVSASKSTVAAFVEALRKEPFVLTIKDAA